MRRSSTQILADATSALVQGSDVTHALATLLRDCGEALSAGAVGLVVRADNAQVELLSSTCHQAPELFEAFLSTGPCVEAIACDGAISVVGSADILTRWPGLGPSIIERGYHSVHASPLRWRGEPLGALGALFVNPSPRTKKQVLLAQFFADVASLVLMHTADLSAHDVSERIRSALGGRVIVEQAKGVIAFQQSLDMSAAYDLLVSTASKQRMSLTVTAERFVAAAQHPKGPG